MTVHDSLAFYLVIGVGVAFAHALAERGRFAWASAIAACLFWPLFLPLVLASATPAPARPAPRRVDDEFGPVIDQVERELDQALSSLDGWADEVLQRKDDQLRELRGALVAQADRIRDMENVFSREQATLDHGAAIEFPASGERTERSRQARLDNMNRLRDLCGQARSDLFANLAWIRELASMIHLAKFTGAPAARVEELVAQIAAAVESIASLSTAPNLHDAEPASRDRWFLTSGVRT